MKTNHPYALKEAIRKLCVKNDYFNCGDNIQYQMMFDAAVCEEFSTRDVAVMIYINSMTADLKEVETELILILDAIEKHNKPEDPQTITEEAILAHLQYLLDEYNEEKLRYGLDDRVVTHHFYEMIGCKNMAECLLHKPVNLEISGKVTTGF